MTTATAVKTRPILFSAEMVRAIRSGQKTVTRRVVVPQPTFVRDGFLMIEGRKIRRPDGWEWRDAYWQTTSLPSPSIAFECPHGVPGDRLYVQESYQLEFLGDVSPAFEAGTGCKVVCRYLADDETREVELTAGDVRKLESRASDRHKPQPGRFMYRSCSRLTLEIVDVQAEWLHDISDEDVIAEGFPVDTSPPHDGTRLNASGRRECFYGKWDALNAARGYPADSNPLVRRIEFRVADRA